jgi:hypothetical protein
MLSQDGRGVGSSIPSETDIKNACKKDQNYKSKPKLRCEWFSSPLASLAIARQLAAPAQVWNWHERD